MDQQAHQVLLNNWLANKMKLATQAALIGVTGLLVMGGPPRIGLLAQLTAPPLATYSVANASPGDHASSPQGLSGSLSPEELQMFDLLNTERERSGLAPLELDDRLTELATARSMDMADRRYFSHVSPDGSSARSMMIASRIGPGLMGEILGRNNSSDPTESVQSVFGAFESSPNHRTAILRPRFAQVGVGIANGKDNMRYYAVLFFGP